MYPGLIIETRLFHVRCIVYVLFNKDRFFRLVIYDIYRIEGNIYDVIVQ